ncbi:MAG TPA: HAD family hydrolase [Rhodothermales bacterium]|nr:HAD family hydrolase [Rhodothermales bacterium]
MTLFLFDIDGTILRTDGVGRRAVAHAVEAYFGRSFPFDAVSFSGKTDPQIMREVLTLGGIADADAHLPGLLAAFEQHMHATITPERITVLPGVADLLDRLAARDDVVLALLTGNLESTAFAKLRAAGLDHHFAFGAFGSDAEIRNDLPAVALARAEQHLGHRFDPKRVVIVGDTEHDVACARVIGACAVAVATGHHDRAALEAHAPDHLFDSCEDAEAFLEAVLSVEREA